MHEKRIYLDNNATTFLAPEVKEEILRFIGTSIGNPSSPHYYGQQAKSLLSHYRKRVASYFSAAANQILFTSGGTEGADLCIRGLLPEKGAPRIITSRLEHACVFETCTKLAKQGAELVYLPASSSGAIQVEDLERELAKGKTDLIVLMAVNNETGVMNEWEKMSDLAKAAKVPFVVDGVALLGKEPFTIPDGVTAMFFSGHKIHALQGTGFVYVKPRIKLHPQQLGGSQEFGMRGGTENLLGIAALSRAVELLHEKLPSAASTMRHLRDTLEAALLKIPGTSVNGSGKRVSNTTNIAFSGKDGETFLIALDRAGLACSLGSACASGAIEPSRILLEMGVPMGLAQASLRFSISRETTYEEIEKAIQIIRLLA